MSRLETANWFFGKGHVWGGIGGEPALGFAGGSLEKLFEEEVSEPIWEQRLS